MTYLAEWVTKHVHESVWVDLVRVGSSFSHLSDAWDRLAQLGCEKLLETKNLSLDELIVIGKYLTTDRRSSDPQHLVDRWLVKVSPTGTESPREVLNFLISKQARINMYCEYPDGQSSSPVAAAYCGIFLTITLGVSSYLDIS
jgi:hypothetical protein